MVKERKKGDKRDIYTLWRGKRVCPVGRGPVRPVVSDLHDVPDLRQLVAVHLVQLLLVVHHEDVGPAVLGHVARGVGRVGRVDAATEVKKIKYRSNKTD